MLTLISAVPGSGKTLYCIQEMLKHLKNGRRVYSNINGLKISEVLPLHHDWRDHDNGSVLFIDECHEHPAYSADPIPYEVFIEPTQLEKETDNDHRKRVTKELAIYKRQKDQYTEQQLDIARSLSLHRHFGFDIYLITQSPDRVRQVVLNLVGMHIHLHRAMGLERSTKYLWRYAQTWPNGKAAKSETESTETFKFNENHYHLYESSEKHTHKRAIPRQYIIWGSISVLVMGYALNTFAGTSFFGLNPFHDPKNLTVQTDKISDSKTQTLMQKTQAGETQTKTEETPYEFEEKRVAMVSRSDGFYCRAYDGNGNLMQNIKYEDCVYYADNPIALRMGDLTMKNERLQAVNYNAPQQQTNGQFNTTRMPPDDGIVSLN